MLLEITSSEVPGGVPELKANGEQGKDKTQQFLQCFLLLPMVTRATQSQFQSCPFPSVPITPQQTIILSHTSSARCVSVGQSCPSSSFLHVHLRSLPSSSFKHMQRSPWEFPAHSVGVYLHSGCDPKTRFHGMQCDHPCSVGIIRVRKKHKNKQTWGSIKPTMVLLLLPPLLCQPVSQQTQCQLSLYIVSPRNKNMPAPSLDNRCKAGKVQ